MESLSRQWGELAARAAPLVVRAAQEQARQAHLDIDGEAKRLWILYEMANKPRQWREHGDIALHLAVSHPPDLAYALVYAIREQGKSAGIDPVPMILTAIERLFFVRPENLRLHLDRHLDAAREPPRERARRAMRILVREVSVTSYPHAAGIWREIDERLRPFLREALAEFNPRGAEILARSGGAWLRSRAGARNALLRLRKWLLRMLFGNG
jgi:hypothetical protein